MRYAEHITELVGGTPLVRLTSVTAGLSATVLANVSYAVRRGEIDRNGFSVPACGRDGGQRGGIALRVDIRQQDLGAFRGDPFGDSAADI